MAIFDETFHEGPSPKPGAVERYRAELAAALAKADDRDALVRGEVVAITKAITDGILDLIETDRRVGKLVRNGEVPLATWTDALQLIASLSTEAMKRKVEEMERELQHGRVQGFPATLFMAGKPSFTTFRPFYDVAFEAALTAPPPAAPAS